MCRQRAGGCVLRLQVEYRTEGTSGSREGRIQSGEGFLQDGPDPGKDFGLCFTINPGELSIFCGFLTLLRPDKKEPVSVIMES